VSRAKKNDCADKINMRTNKIITVGVAVAGLTLSLITHYAGVVSGKTIKSIEYESRLTQVEHKVESIIKLSERVGDLGDSIIVNTTVLKNVVKSIDQLRVDLRGKK